MKTVAEVSLENVSVPLLETPDSEIADKESSRMAFQIFLLSVTSIIVLWYPLKIWWKKRNIRLGNDPSSSLSHLPLPPGDFGLPLIGETFAWITQVSSY